MRPSKGFIVRLAVYWALLIYLALDLFVFTGPLRKRIRRSMPDSPESVAAVKAQGVVARVMGHPILLSQVERAAKEKLWLEGRTLRDLPPAQRRIEKLAALDGLIDFQLLRVKSKANYGELPVSDEEIDGALERLKARFKDEEELQADLAAEGIDSEEELRLRIGGRLQREKYVEGRIAELISVTREEARQWYEENASWMKRPERVRVRHIFVGTLERDASEARAIIDRVKAEFELGRDFASLAEEFSEDGRSKSSGGDLGWMTKDRLPADFAVPVFGLPMKRAEIIRTKLGWHLAEVTDRRKEEAVAFEEAEPEIIVALGAVKRKEAVKELRRALRERESRFIEVYPEMISE